MKTNIDQSRTDFFSEVFGDTRGFCCIAWQEPLGGIFKQEFFFYPDNRKQLVEFIRSVERGHNVWFSPHLYEKPARKKDNAVETRCCWADLDECNPAVMGKFAPPIVIVSSPNRYQGIWPLDTAMPPRVAEDYSHRIAVKFKDQGADQSGWDLTQLLRVPFTYNYKYRKGTELPPQVQLLRDREADSVISVSVLDELPVVPAGQTGVKPMPFSLPDVDAVRKKYLRKIPDAAYKLLDMPPVDDADWSKLLWNLELLLFEAGLEIEEVFVLCAGAACNKFARDNKPARFLWDDICRAEAYHDYASNVVPTTGTLQLPRLVGENESGTKVPFIEDYVAWASSKTDAALQYHEATAFVILSALLAGNLHIELEFGTVRPNLWIMLIADTTLTRKSTAMEMGIHLLGSIFGGPEDKGYDPILATDGSVEGLFSAMQSRSGRPSLFLKDEFTGLMESIAKKDFMAGMLELLTKLYDGTTQKRLLKKETITVTDPVLIIFAGGIKNKLYSILRDEHVSSGFLPRFIIISADSDVSKRRPIRRRSDEGTAEREALVRELSRLKDIYTTPTVIQLPGSDATVQQSPTVRVDFTDEALDRLDDIEQKLVTAGIYSEQPDAYVPMFDRLAKSCMKMAALIAAARQEPVDETIWITEGDIVTAASYIERWSMYTIETLTNVGKSLNERVVERVLTFIKRYPQGVQRSQVMNSMRLNAQDMQTVIINLEMRGLITVNKKGKALWLFPEN